MAKKKKANSNPPEQREIAEELRHQVRADLGSAEVAARAADFRDFDKSYDIRLSMAHSLLVEPLLSRIQVESPWAHFEVILELNELYGEGLSAAVMMTSNLMAEWQVRYSTSSRYVFASLSREQILELTRIVRDQTGRLGPSAGVIHRIWEDSFIQATLTTSLSTIKADSAHAAFRAHGNNIVWAMLDSGIDGTHPHFQTEHSPYGAIRNLEIPPPLQHADFTPGGRMAGDTAYSALIDRLGHGTHAAGIIAGYWQSMNPEGEAVASTDVYDEMSGQITGSRELLVSISGVAPRCKLVSLKVIADVSLAGDARQTAGEGRASWVLMALDQIQQWNQHGNRILVHGVNMSFGCDFDPRWAAAGQSPMCQEVNRLVRSGVVVVTSAGNSGLAAFLSASGTAEARLAELAITDPGNADLAITVGSTHRATPHVNGVSYFSARGPTGDGRMKPDLVAPGERILSCAAGMEAQKIAAPTQNPGFDTPGLYSPMSGTSTACAHVSGAVAAFLSVYREFIGQPERVKQLFMENAADLHRDRAFQGAGLLDLLKVMQSV